MIIDNLTILMNVDGKPVIVDTRKIEVNLFCIMVAGLQESKNLQVFPAKNMETVNLADYVDIKPKGNKDDSPTR